MARMLLGDEIDLHSGGEDNIFPHHECEIAQSCCASGRPTFARMWFHTRHLQVEGQKMSKSKGNFFTARDLFARGITPAALRLELIRTHYRTNANFTMQGLQDCQRMVDRWDRLHRDLSGSAGGDASGLPDESRPPGPLESCFGDFVGALCDDLNVARAIAAVNSALGHRVPRACRHRELRGLLTIDSVLGVLGRNTVTTNPPEPDHGFLSRVEALVARRTAARAARDWAASDEIRSELTAMGVTIVDGPAGTTWTRAADRGAGGAGRSS
jgi:cysteinyl-tRNA synthetase